MLTRAVPVVLACLISALTLRCTSLGLLGGGNASSAYGVRGLESIPRYDSCAAVREAFATCRPLPVAVNLHYFTTDDCGADSIGIEQGIRNLRDARYGAEELIRTVNTFFREMSDNPPMNNPAHGAEDYRTQCVPFRVVLAGLYVHCDSRYQRTIPRPSQLRAYAVDPETTINYFLGNFKRTNGYANSLGGALGAQGGYGPGTMAHELLHMFGAPHAFDDDGCDDTWGRLDWTWDKDGDGVVDARGRRCWDEWPTPRRPDGEFAEPDYCAPGNYVTPHPCCDPANQNGNLMTYSTYAQDWHRSTLSPCQVEKAVRHLAERKCDYIYGVGGRVAPREYVFRMGEPRRPVRQRVKPPRRVRPGR